MYRYVLLLLLIQNLACSRSYMVRSESTNVAVAQVNVLAVEYSRPDYPVADHDDFKVKNRRFECDRPDELWSEAVKNQEKVSACLNSIKEGKATFFYVPAAQPYLEFDAEEKTNPKCLKEVLAKIPLPREIYYLGKREDRNLDEDQLECFSSSFATDTNQLMMTPTGFLKKKIVLPFPLDRSLKNAHDVAIWLMVTTFAILKNDEKAEGKLMATPVTDLMCRSCFKNDALFEDKFSRKLKPVFWP